LITHQYRRNILPRIYESSSVEAEGIASTSVAVLKDLLESELDKMNQVMTSDFFQASDSLKQLYSQCKTRLIVKESSISRAGKGLFATKNIKAGSVVSFYPAHALGIELGDQQLWVSSNEADKKHFAKNPPGQSSYLHATDQPIFNRPSFIADVVAVKDEPIYLDANPNRQTDPLWVSQYINDGAVVSSNDERGVAAYYQQSKRKKNCLHLPLGPSPIMATVTTRKVKKGEELLTSYGCVYWLGVLYSDDDESPPDMTNQIQQGIRESAQDLFASMKNIASIYGNQIEALQNAYREL